MKKGIKIKQSNITDCGAVCLASVSAYYGLHYPVSRIKQFACTDNKGTNVLGLIEAAAKLGLTAKGVKGPYDSLFKIPKPAIAHLVIGDQLHHYVVIYKINKNYVEYMDPADGQMHRVNHEEFRTCWSGVVVLLVPDETFEPGNRKESVSLKFLRLIKPHRGIMIQALVGSVIYSILGLTASIYVEKLVDFVLTDGNLKLLNLLSVIMLVLLALRIYIGCIKSVFIIRTGQRIDASLILGYYKHLLTLPQLYFDTMRTGEILSRINDAVKIRIFINNILLDLVVNSLIVLFTVLLMIIYSVKLTLIVILSIPLYYLVYYITNRINRKYLRRNMETSADLESHLVESMNNMATIKQFGLEDYAHFKTEMRFISVLKTVYKSSVTNVLSNKITTMLGSLLTIVVLWSGAIFVINQELTVGELMSFYALTGFLITPVSFLIQSNETIQNAMIATDRLFQILDLEQENVAGKQFDITPELIKNVKIKNVTFRYGTRNDVFENFTLTIETGKMTAIVGESGSGKSTLIKLLQNLYPVQHGSIEIGDYNVKHITPSSLRKVISVVPQQIDLFAATITENIAPGEFEPDMHKIVELCRNLNMLPFIEKLPDGFATKLGEHGASLSGGERQRIAIARALYRNPEILILDEATSSLDSDSEQYVQSTIDYLLKQNKTIIVIAHRLSTIQRADNIVVIQSGKVIEQGTHTNLLSAQGKYASLWNKQNSCVF